MSPVPSVLWSSTTMISRLRYPERVSADRHAPMFPASLRAGTMIDTRGPSFAATCPRSRGQRSSDAPPSSTSSAQGASPISSTMPASYATTRPANHAPPLEPRPPRESRPPREPGPAPLEPRRPAA